MKLNNESQKKFSEDTAERTMKTLQAGQTDVAPLKNIIPKHFRRLKWNELVSHGDFIAHDHQGLKPWEGPGGFRADAFLHPIYRSSRSPASGRGFLS